ncbi:YxiF family protein [Priestia flexa]|uniref:YxiF family protein n=1 Tax=Priestia flexa TaxID=86664 RepID=UPI00077C65FE|nr:hypothetical protein [Priestia flexa]MED4590680.1 hypothetical protein [Priestia flexa]WEZ06875.1 hypothetical protein P5663_12255 [Priestia flexa]
MIREEAITQKIVQDTKSEGRKIDNHLRKEKIAELKRKNYLKKAEDNFKKCIPDISSFEMNNEKVYLDKLEFIYSSKLKLKVSFEHDEQRIKVELEEFQNKIKDYPNQKVVIYNGRKHEQLPNLIIELKDFYKNLESILDYTEANNSEAYFWFILISVDEKFGIFISEDEYGMDSIFYWGIE